MQARTIDLTRLFEPTTRYGVPLFQRPYVWDRAHQWEPLWDDVRAAADRLTDANTDNDEVPHFLGAIVLQLESVKDITVKRVIDGQQRLTTMQLLIAAARRVARDRGEDNLCKRLETLLFFDDYLIDDPDERFKVVPTNADRAAFRLAVADGVLDGKKVPSGDSVRTIEAYAFFHGAIREWADDVGDDAAPADRLKALVKVLRQLLRVVVIDLDEPENAQAIFETMNARGTPLLAADLVKNFIFQRIPEPQAPTAYANHWASFDRTPWRREVGVGRSKRPRIDLFLGHWLTMTTDAEVHWQELFIDFRKHVVGASLPAESVLEDLDTAAATYDGFDAFPVGSPEWLFFYRLNVMEATTFHPVVLRIFGGRGIDDPVERLAALHAIESWLVRRMLCRLTAKQYNGVVLNLLKRFADEGAPSAASLIDYLAGLEGESQVWPSDDAVSEAIRVQPYYLTLSRGRLRMVLEAIEAALRGPMNLPFADWGRLTVEHILPQNWWGIWTLPGIRSEAEERIARDSAKHRIGNLTLVAQPLNSKLSNALWTAAPGEGKRDGLRVHNVYMLNKPLVELEDWDESRIAERGDDLAAIVLSIWPRPELASSRSGAGGS